MNRRGFFKALAAGVATLAITTRLGSTLRTSMDAMEDNRAAIIALIERRLREATEAMKNSICNDLYGLNAHINQTMFGIGRLRARLESNEVEYGYREVRLPVTWTKYN
jgi:hypothetical protein